MGTKLKTQKIPLGFLQNLPKFLDQKIPCRITPSLRWNSNSQHCSANNVVCCCVLVAVVCKRFNNSQQHAATCNRVSKRTQHVTSWQTLGVVSTCWPAMLRPFALCTGLSNWQGINSLPKSRRVRTPSRKKNSCDSILVSEHLIIRFWGGRLWEVRINTCVRLSETKRRAEAKYIFKDIQFNDSGRLHELSLRSTDLSFTHIGMYRSSAVAK